MKIVEARERYGAWLKDKGLTHGTVAQKVCHVRQLESYLKKCGVDDLSNVTTASLAGYKAELKTWKTVATDRALSPLTMESYLSSIKSFFDKAVASGWVLSSPAAGVMRGLPPRRPVQSFLSEQEMEKVLARPDVAMPIGLRDRLILELMYSTGIRMGEVVDLAMADLELGQNILHVKASTGGKERSIPLTGAVRSLMDQYVKEIRPVWDHPMKRGGTRRRATALFYSPRRGPMSEDHLEKMVGGHVRAVRPGVPNAGQAIRYACGVRLLSGGKTVAEVNELFGQTKMIHTEAYTRAMVTAHPTKHS